MNNIKGYKVFNPDWTCRGFQYKVGETFTHNGNIEMCGSGFHFCKKASDCFNYYNFDRNNKVAEVEAIGLVETEGNKSVTDKIVIVREILWQELLTIVNEGEDCTGLCNTGGYNTGDHNTGGYNTGDRNTGGYNTGDYNTGNRNTGDRNTGDRNTGDRNTGNYNTGDCNTGNYNTGDCNTGNYNSANFSTGFFNSIMQPLFIFDQPTELKRNDIYNCKGVQVLNWNFENSWWIYEDNMTEEEKSKYPTYKTAGGYLKTVDFKTACNIMWNNLDKDDRQSIKEIPNFNAKVFEKITGIKIV